MTPANQTYGFYMPFVSLMGVGSHKELGPRIRNMGCSCPLVICGKDMVPLARQIMTEVEKDLKIKWVLYDGVVPNPTVACVHEGLDLFKSKNCDAIITIGGGSAHDCGKGIGIVATNGGKIQDYEGVDKSSNAMPPFIAVNTTAGTGSEITRFTIITDSDRHVKMAIIDWRVTPMVAINDPLLMVGMPKMLTACTGMDALTHAIEAYVSTLATPVTDCVALQAISLIADYLRPAVANGQDLEARDRMAYAEYLAGMAFNNASLGYVHAMAHQLGGVYNLPHGMCNAILLPHVERFNLIARADRFADIAEALGENTDGLSARDAAEVALDAITTLSSDVGIPDGLKELGVKDQDIKLMAENAMKDACGATNPRHPTLEDVMGVFRSAM